MSIDVKIKADNSKEVLEELNNKIAIALEICGGEAEKYAKQNLTDNKSVDTGRLRNSITHATYENSGYTHNYTDNNGKPYSQKVGKVNSGDDSVYIGTNVEYAEYVELGTSRQKAKPYLKPAVENHTDTYKKIIKQTLES